MKRLQTSLFTALGLAVLGGALSLTYQKGVEAQVGSTPVRVVNLPTAPALTRDVDRREPYASTSAASTPSGDTVVVVLTPAPFGKRLVVENVGLEVLVPPGQAASARLSLSSPSFQATILPVPVQFQRRTTSFDFYYGMGRTLGFARPGTAPELLIQRSSTSGTMAVTATVTGYLEDL